MFSNNNINKLFFLLIKGVYSCKYMDEWEKFNKKTLPKKKSFKATWNIAGITDADYIIQKDFQINNLMI